MDVVCEACGVANRDGTEFCLFCGAYLAWDRTAARPAVPTPTPPVPSAEVALPTAVVATPQPADDPPPAPVAVATAPEPRPSFTPGGGPACAVCGRSNEPGRRFCAKCGQTLADGASRPRPAAKPSSRRRAALVRDRAARLAYRRSLPPLYRWRRVVVSVLALALVGGGLTVAGRHPVRWAGQRWYDVLGTTVPVTGVQAATDPARASVEGSDPASLVDGTQQGWTMAWAPAAEGGSCGGAPGTGSVVLTFPAARVRKIQVTAGLVATDPQRPLQVRPQAIGLRFDGPGPGGAECRRFTLQDVPDTQTLTVDSGVPVTTVRIGVDTTYASRPDGRRLLSFTEIGLEERPS